MVAALQHLEKTETSSVFPLGAAAHVIGWNARSSKAEMNRLYNGNAETCAKEATGFRVELASFLAETFSKIAEEGISFFT